MENALENAKIAWHPGFYGAIEMELMANKGLFEFQMEYNLSKEPLRMDMLIIKKLSDVPAENEIGYLFRKYNVVEYKCPGDGFSIDDYYKIIGYACLYKGLGEIVDQIPARELTISVFCDQYPREMFRILKQMGLVIEEPFCGIYYIKGQVLFGTQIIVTSSLKGAKHKSLRLLSTKAKEADVRAFVEETLNLTEPGDRNNAEAVLRVSIAANRSLYDRLRRESAMYDVLRDLLKEEIEEEIQEKMKKAREEEQENLLAAIRNLMVNMKLKAGQAMEAMGISVENMAIYKEKL